MTVRTPGIPDRGKYRNAGGSDVADPSLCQTCGGIGFVERPASADYEIQVGLRTPDQKPCPHCIDGRVPTIQISKQGGAWPIGDAVCAALEVHLPEDVKPYSYRFIESVLDALADASKAQAQ